MNQPHESFPAANQTKAPGSRPGAAVLLSDGREQGGVRDGGVHGDPSGLAVRAGWGDSGGWGG